MAYGKSLTNHARKHGDNLGFINEEAKKRAIRRLDRAIARANALGVPRNKQHKVIPNHIINSAILAQGKEVK